MTVLLWVELPHAALRPVAAYLYQLTTNKHMVTNFNYQMNYLATMRKSKLQIVQTY